MTDLSLGFIYAIKEDKQEDLWASAIEFLSSYSGADPQWYTDEKLDRIALQVFVDFLDTADYPSATVIKYFDGKRMWHWGDTEAMLNALRLSTVRNSAGNYVNGFRDMKC